MQVQDKIDAWHMPHIVKTKQEYDLNHFKQDRAFAARNMSHSITQNEGFVSCMPVDMYPVVIDSLKSCDIGNFK